MPGNQRWIGTYSQELEMNPDPGGVFYFYPDGTITELTPPTGVTGTSSKSSFSKWVRGTQKRLYINGGHTSNIVVLEDDRVVINGIPDFTQTLVAVAPGVGQAGVTAGPNPGLTGTCIVYLRWKDSIGQRIGPLSDGVEITLANQGLTFTGVSTTPGDSSVDQVEVWVSVSGGFPRRFQAFNLASSFVTTELVTGEAEIEPFESFPLCKYNAIYHDRLVMAGDEDQPQRIYFSQIGQLEQYGGLFLDTRIGEKVRGIYVLRDSLIVQTDNAHYIIHGFDENDISINTLSPSIGGLGHHTVVMVDDISFFPSRYGWHVCDSTSIKKIGANDFSTTWTTEQHWSLYTDSRFGFSMHDAESQIIKFKTPSGTQFSPMTGYPSANNAGICWVIDYGDYIRGNGDVLLSIDTVAGTSGTEPTASAMLMDTDGSMRLYTGHASGLIAEDNIYGNNDVSHDFEYVWQSPQIEISKPGDDADAAAVVKLWVCMMNEDIPIEWTLFAGNSYDWQSEEIAGRSGGRQPAGTIAAGAETLGTAARVYRDRVLINSEQSAGFTVSLLLRKLASATEAPHPAFSGAPTRTDGIIFLAPTFSFRGWGFTYKMVGENNRGVRPYVA